MDTKYLNVNQSASIQKKKDDLADKSVLSLIHDLHEHIQLYSIQSYFIQ